MKAVPSRVAVFLRALRILSRAEKRAVIASLLEDDSIREDVLDLAMVRQRRVESGRPFSDYRMRTRAQEN